jgi:ribosomal-protein-alanine N-acetyltransferase
MERRLSTRRASVIARVDIVPALSDDAPALAALHATCFDDPWQAELIARVVGSPGGFGVVARALDAPIGFALCRSTANEGEVLTLCVEASMRRQGIGRALLRATLDQVKTRDLAHLFLEVAEDNVAARALYASHDFRMVGRRSAYYRRASGVAVDALTLCYDAQSRVEDV